MVAYGSGTERAQSTADGLVYQELRGHSHHPLSERVVPFQEALGVARRRNSHRVL